MTDYYGLLNIRPTATSAEIQDAYARARARLLSNGTAEGNSEALKAIDEAYATLIDPNRRTAYDRSLRGEAPDSALVAVHPPGSLVQPQAPPIAIPHQACPSCGALNPVQTTICPNCGRQITRPCPNCGQPVVLSEIVCPRCNTSIQEYDKQRYSEAVAAEKRIQTERRATEVRVEALEAGHRVRRWLGLVFWAIVAVVCLGLAIFTVLLFNYASR